MPLPEPSQQECESVRAGQEPSLGSKKPQESSSLVPDKDKEKAKPTDGVSQETSGTATLPNNTPQVVPAKKQGRIIHRKRSRVDAGEIPEPCHPGSAQSIDLHTHFHPHLRVTLDTPLFLPVEPLRLIQCPGHQALSLGFMRTAAMRRTL